jgi:VWFA-related protein
MAMRLAMTAVCAAILVAFCAARWAHGQTSAGSTEQLPPFKLSVDEVSLRFHASGADGLAVNDLKLDELSLLDNGSPPRRIVAFSPLQNLPIRAGILLDTSASMAAHLGVDRAVSIEFAQRVLRQRNDQAFVMEFGYISNIAQTWTSDTSALTRSIGQAVTGRDNPLGGTALFDTLFRACFNVIGQVDHARSGNVILLFSDGEDNHSYMSLAEVVNVCQKSNTAIYTFRAEPNPSLWSSGPKVLSDLAAQTGGRAFASADSEAEVVSDLLQIEADLRNEYRLIYNPPALQHDGAFHRIELKMPERVASMVIRSGYYDRPR